MTTLTPVAQRRITSEMKDWINLPPEGCKLTSCEPMTQWVVEIEGPLMYTGEVFHLRIIFTERYPLEPPDFCFINNIPCHNHIYSNGHICLDILYDSPNAGWSPALTINKVALSLRSMLASSTSKQRPPGDQDYCKRVKGRSSKLTRWEFEDDTV
jgi:ubiquitin-protein ligase